MVDKKYVPERGDIVWLTFSPQAGHEQAGLRPAIVISPKSYNAKIGLALFCPITTKIKKYPFEVLLPPFCKTTGVVLCDQVKSFDWGARKIKFLEKVPKEIINSVLGKLGVLVTL